MSNKDKELSKSKFKFFLKNAKQPNVDRTFKSNIESELRPDHPPAHRCKILKELAEQHLHNHNLTEQYITKIWDLTKDLIASNKPAEYRQTALTFYKRLIYTQYKNLTLMREHFFLVIQNHDVPEDIKYRLELLDTLTENGKDINNFEEKIGPFMLSWLQDIVNADLLRPYLDMLVNLIKFNAAHLDNDIVVDIVHNACHLSCNIEDETIGLQCLSILEMVMGYTIFPSDPLALCVFTLCRTVNHRPYCQASWKIMKNLLGTQLGYHAMKLMCNILNDRTLYEDAQLIRGTVFHLNMSIFGSNIIFQVSPMFYASTVLTSFLHALDSRQVIVTYEVILSVKKVINKYKTELSEIIWDRICDIMSAIIDNIEYYEKTNVDYERLQHLRVNFHENIDCIEKLIQDEKAHILANFERIYNIIERVCEQRPEASVLHLIEYRSSKIIATSPEWLRTLKNFVTRFYRMSNAKIRIKTIESLVRIMDLNRACYEEEILERVVLEHFFHIAHESDINVRVAATHALVDFAKHCDTERCGKLLDALATLINRPFDHKTDLRSANNSSSVEMELSPIKSEADILDIIAAVDGLIEIFILKLYRLPSRHAVVIFDILCGFLEQHYERPRVFEPTNIVRYKIFMWIMKARANGTYHIGYPDPNNHDILKFSHYLGIDSTYALHIPTMPAVQHQSQQQLQQTQHQHRHSSTLQESTISIRRACRIIIKCLGCDRDYKIFHLVLKELPKMFQNKPLIHGRDIDEMAKTLLKIFFDGNKSLNLTVKPTTDEFHALILPAIAALVTYHQFLHAAHHNSIITALKLGIFSGVANICINTMTTMILEMPEALMRPLPDILLQMSKMSDTNVVAIPVLEFLSILSRLSNNLFTNFTPTQYKYVFAISLPYTKPHRYDHYTVSLAHHVIAGWFLKCKLELRKHFVSYIIKFLQSNASMLYDDINKFPRNIQRQDFNTLNEDSSNRKRSTSLTERGSRNSAAANARNDSDMRPLMNDNLKSFHAELVETCIDFLARHTFSPCSALPKRLPAVEYLLKDGLSQTWLVGHNLVTITTSGCPSAPSRNGLCDRCAQLGKLSSLSTASSSCVTGIVGAGPPLSPEIAGITQQSQLLQHQHQQQQQLSTPSPAFGANTNSNVINAERRYTKVSLQHSSGNESAGSTDLTSSSSTSTVPGGTQRQTSNSSTASLEALPRRGSNPESAAFNSSCTTADIAAVGAVPGATYSGGVGHISGSNTSLLGGHSISTASTSASPTAQLHHVQQQICIRSCTGWAEILIRRPTGNVSWITRLQNPISNDCFGQDLPLSYMMSLFLPTSHGGIFGPDFMQSTLRGIPTIEDYSSADVETPQVGHIVMQPYQSMSASRECLGNAVSQNINEERKQLVPNAKVRALQRQEELTSSTVSTAAIDIPKPTSGKRGKEALSGSVSDGEADEESMAFEDPTMSRSRNPVRRVNSSPEMSSSWRQTFLASKPAPLSGEMIRQQEAQHKLEEVMSSISEQQLEYQQQVQKKKSIQYTKDMRVSCEAIPEEIAGSTPPQAQHENTEGFKSSADLTQSSVLTKTASAEAASSGKTVAIVNATLEAGTALPPKQHSADDVSSSNAANIQLPAVQQSSSATSLKSHASPATFSCKPPLSPAPQSPRLDSKYGTTAPTFNILHSNMLQKANTFTPIHAGLAKSSSSGGNGSGNGSNLNMGNQNLGNDFNNGNDMIRGRSKTISVVREVNGKTRPSAASNFRSFGPGGGAGVKPQGNAKLCMNPSFVFMQLYNTGDTATEMPIKVPPEHTNAVTLLDLVPPYETHKIGVLYVGQDQCNNAVEILRNSHGSVRYVEFLRNIGTLVSLKEAEKNNLFLCLDTGGSDGKFTYVWKDDIVQVTFHVATLMPTNLERDPNCNEKKKHIGNDFVNIIYNESGEEYNLKTISGQFSYACVIVEPLELNTNRVYVKARPEIEKFVCHPEPKIVSDRSAPLLARQLALHANLASLVYQRLQEKNPYASNWLERLRKIKRLRTKLLESQPNQHQSGGMGANSTGVNVSNVDLDDNSNDPLRKRQMNCDFTKYA